MKFWTLLTRPITSEKLEDKGQSFYKLGKIFCFCGLCGFALLLLSVLITLIVGGGDWVVDLLIFDIDDDFAFMYAIIPVAYLGVCLGLIGIPLYFSGLNIFALGRIAHNTEKE